MATRGGTFRPRWWRPPDANDRRFLGLSTNQPVQENLYPTSEQMPDATTTNLTVSANGATAPDGETTAEVYTDDATNDLHYVQDTTSVSLSASDSGWYTVSIYGKKVSGSDRLIELDVIEAGFAEYVVLIFNPATGALVSKESHLGTADIFVRSGIAPAANGYYRAWIAAPFTSGNELTNVDIYLGDTNNDFTYAGDGSQVAVWGLQVNRGIGPAEYIQTGAGSVDGNADGDTVTAIASLIAGTASGAAVATGATATTTASIVTGSASGAATATGETVASSAAIVNGTATGAAGADGETVSTTTALVDGACSGGASAEGEECEAECSVADGNASGGANAEGALLEAEASLIAGSASGGFDVGTIEEIIRLAPMRRRRRKSVEVQGATLTAHALLLSGEATGEANAPSDTLAAKALEVSGGEAIGAAGAQGAEIIDFLPHLNARAGGGSVQASAALISGRASGTNGPDPDEDFLTLAMLAA